MSITACVMVNNVAQDQPGLKVGAFVGSQLRGTANATLLSGHAVFFMTVYSNQTSGETVTYKVYTSTDDQVHDAAETNIYARNTTVGNAMAPYPLHLTVAAPPADLELSQSVDDGAPAVGDTVVFCMILKNAGGDAATLITVLDSISPALTIISSDPAIVFVGNIGTWQLASLGGGISDTVKIKAKVTAPGLTYSLAEVAAATAPGDDSTPGNHALDEDDIALTCVSAPVEICPGEAFNLTLPAGTTGIQWHDQNGPIAGQTGLTLNVTAPGEYWFESTSANCPPEGCCPARFVLGSKCCPPKVCLPIVARRN